MQANFLNNLLNMPQAQVSAAGKAVGAKPAPGGVVGNEFAALLNAKGTVQAQIQPGTLPTKNLLQLISRLLSPQAQLLDHPALRPTVKSLIGDGPSSLDQLPMAKLMSSNTSPTTVLSQLQKLLNSDPAILAAVKQDPQAAAQLNLQIGSNAAMPVEFNQKATLEQIKETFVQPMQQKISPELLAQDQKISQMVGMQQPASMKSRANNLNDDVLSPITERKSLPKQNGMAMKQYGEEQQQFKSNIIRMPARELEQLQFQQDNADQSLSQNMSAIVQGHEQGARAQVITPQVTAQTQVLDLSNVSASSPNELIEKITTYIQQNAIQKTDGLDVVVRHAELGQFRVSVQQQSDDTMQMHILTNSKVGHDFFKAHEGAIVRALADAGVGVGDFQVMASMPTRSTGEGQGFSENRGGQFSSSQQQHNHNQHGDSNQRDSQRRRDLWEEYRQRYSA